MTRRSIALIVDHPQRDLAGLVLTAYELCGRGFDCHLVPLNLQEPEVWALGPDFVLVNYLRRFNEPFLRRLREARIAYGLLDTEGGVFGSFEEYAELHCEDPTLLRDARCECMWGPRLAGWLVAQDIYPKDRIAVTGCPRFDLYHPSWRTVLFDEAERAADARPRILLNANFAIVNPRFTSSKENIALYHAQLGWSRERLAEYTAIEQAAIDGTIALARVIAERFPSCTVVMRPHPHESPEPYRAGLAGIPNVELNMSGHVLPQIFRAAAVVQRSCTTALESVLADVPTLSPQWIVPPVLVPFAESVSIGCASPDAMCEELERIIAGRYVADAEFQREKECVIAEWFHRRDGLAHERVGDAVVRALEDWGERRVDDEACRRFMYALYRDERQPRPKASNRLRHAMGLSPNFSFRRARLVPDTWWTSTDKAFTADEVNTLLARIIDAHRRTGGRRAMQVVATRSARRYRHASYLGHSVTVEAVGGS